MGVEADMLRGSIGVAVEVMEVVQGLGMTIAAGIPKDQNLLLIEFDFSLFLIIEKFLI